MEIDEFRNIWKEVMEREVLASKTDQTKIAHTMKANDTLTLMTEKTIRRWKFTRNAIILLFISIGTGLCGFIFYPEKFQNIEKALPVYLTIALYGLLTLWAYYEKVKIFDGDALSIKSAITRTIGRFRRWYVLTTLIFIMIYPVIFMVVVSMIVQLTKRDIPFRFQIAISIVLAVVTLIRTHFYYKRTYFRWIKALQENLKELGELD